MESTCWAKAEDESAKSAKKVEKNKKKTIKKEQAKRLPRKDLNQTVRLKIAQMNQPGH